MVLTSSLILLQTFVRSQEPVFIQKLLYFSQGFHKAFTGEYLFEDDCEAWVHGPVYRNIYDKYKDYGCNPIEEKKLEFENTSLAEDEKKLLDCIVHYFGCYSGKVLEKMTHTEEPWRVARRGLNDWESSERIISKESISTYFAEVKSKYKMLNFTDIKDYTTNLFDKLYS